MKRHFEKELDSLKTTLIKMASLTEEVVREANESFLAVDRERAAAVVENDERINSMEMEIDNAIVDLLALQQPVASDLRLILATQKINNDLERIGDHAVNIAQSALTFASRGEEMSLLELPQMARIAESMLREAIDGFIHQDPAMSMSVLKKDDIIDQMNVRLVQEMVARMKSDRTSIDCGIDIIRVSRNLERIADLATNIAEEVIFILQARVVKHHAEEKEPPSQQQTAGA
ncbi:MAG TPA: phosphate signaling complex protein PhoU [Bacteroidota bacterium]|nr:phosphate signaling complex protein PhoU [Bacteroidota bacterium]